MKKIEASMRKRLLKINSQLLAVLAFVISILDLSSIHSLSLSYSCTLREFLEHAWTTLAFTWI